MKHLIKEKSRKSFHQKFRHELVAYGMLAYPLLHWGVFFVFSLLRAFYLSFTKWGISSSKSPRFVGVNNYIQVIQDPDFLMAMKNTLLWTVAMAIGPVLIGLLMAVLINGLHRGQTFF